MKRRREGSRYQRVVDGWADLTAWPTAKKTALAMAIASPLHLAVGLCGVAALSLSPELVDLPRFVRMNATLVAITMMLFLVTLPAARRGKEARWTVYLVIVVYGSCLTWVIWLFGAASTPLYGLAPLVVLLVLVYWDPRAGRFALAFMLVGVVTVSYLELSGRVAHAPLLLRRTFDAQRTLGWYLVVSLDVLTKERAVRRGLRLERNLDPQLGRIYADERKVKQVLINLLSNAVKFTPEGGTITVSATRGPAVVTLVVQDTGIGIAAEDQELIFEEFRQVGNDYTRKQEGTGLGLAL